jgi:uncharacterized membrane protein YcaP (DUF421 family)
MDAVVRAAVVYILLMAVFRISGKRSLAQITTFDFVLLLVIGEATQQALLGDDVSITNGAIVIVTLVAIDIGLSLVAPRISRLDRILEGTELVIVEDGKWHAERMRKARVSENDVLSSARERHGLERRDQIRYAVIERSGTISIVPYW